MSSDEILYSIDSGVATITLNRPDKMNALTPGMSAELRSRMEQAGKDDAVRAIVLTGAGRCFCAGADLTSDVAPESKTLPVQGTVAGGLDLGSGYDAKYAFVATVPKPVIAMLNGPAVGGGLLLALHCDLRFCADNARFSTMFARRGMIAEYAMAWLMPRLVGPSNALDLLFSARMLQADEALAMGLVDRVHKSEQLADAVYAYAREIAQAVSPRSTRVIKRLVYRSLDQRFEDSLSETIEAMADTRKSADYREGIDAWRERRAARFTGC